MTTHHCAFVATPLGVSSFVGRHSPVAACRRRIARRCFRAALDPSFVHHATPPFDLFAASHLLSAAAGVVADTAQSAGAVAVDAASTAAGAASTAADVVNAAGADAATKVGPIASIAKVIETCLSWLHGNLRTVGVPGAYGLSIILFTGVVKALLFPLNMKQMESTLKMQAIAPKVKALQSEYKDNPTVLNQMTAKLYKDENVNPLAGCAPILVQLPVWIALYRALQNMAKEDLLNEPFLWVPSLQGPVSQTGQSLSTWLFPLVNGAPPIGWHDALAYLVLPALIVSSQIITTRIMTPPGGGDSQQQANTFNKIIPVIIGWFVLNIPSALGLYMLTNNLLSTAQTLYVRNTMGGGAGAAAAVVPTPTEEPLTTASSRALEAVDGFTRNGTADEPSVKPRPTKGGKGKTKAKRRKRR